MKINSCDGCKYIKYIKYIEYLDNNNIMVSSGYQCLCWNYNNNKVRIYNIKNTIDQTYCCEFYES